MGRRRITEPARAKYKVIAKVAPAGQGAAGGTVKVASAGGAAPPERPGISRSFNDQDGKPRN